MHIVHVALQGCLKSGPVAYGVTADTGGHIRYLLDLVAALEARPEVTRQTVVTRGFLEPELGDVYAQPSEVLGRRTRLLRIFGATTRYLSKEEMHADVPALTAAFLHVLAEQAEPATLVHAHYADAGTLAAAAKARLGIPFVFSAHSLGAMKRRTLRNATADMLAGLARREAIEDGAIAAADRIIASSRDEAEGQLSAYPSARPDRIDVNPPGCALTAFARPVPQDVAAAVAARIEAPLTRDRPPILALARPVWRKNLVGLLEAYAGDAALRERANLVVFAGASHDASLMSEESRAVLAELRRLVALHRLEGCVSLPAHHAPHEVPAIYAWAAARGGVFANPALHEPFGLTLVEAAAAGLPVVATDRGGPRDIVADLRHGVLTDPTAPAAIAAALKRVLCDDALHGTLAAAGRANVARYGWERHADAYMCMAARLTTPPLQLVARPPTALLVSDLDGTLTGGCADGLTRFAAWRRRNARVAVAVATGRSLHDAHAVLAREGIVWPRFLATSLGTEIYEVVDADGGVVADEAWAVRMAADWDPDAIAACLADDERLTPQPEAEQRRFKRSWFATLPSPRDAGSVARRLAAAGVRASVLYSHGRFLDVVPHAAGKGAALAHMARRLGLPLSRTAAAGDSRNDASMLRRAGYGIVVANGAAELAGLSRSPRVVLSAAPAAAGLVEGLERWPALRRPPRVHAPAATALAGERA